jgi:transcriptional regulator with XRE-family HTH domain
MKHVKMTMAAIALSIAAGVPSAARAASASGKPILAGPTRFQSRAFEKRPGACRQPRANAAAHARFEPTYVGDALGLTFQQVQKY